MNRHGDGEIAPFQPEVTATLAHLYEPGAL